MTESSDEIRKEVQSQAERFAALSNDTSLSRGNRAVAERLRDRALELGREFEATLKEVPRTPRPKRSALFSGDSLVHLVAGLAYVIGFSIASLMVAALVSIPFSLFRSERLVLSTWFILVLIALVAAIGVWLLAVRKKSGEEDRRFESDRKHLAWRLDAAGASASGELSALSTDYDKWMSEQHRELRAMAGASARASDEVRSAGGHVVGAFRHLDAADRELEAGAFVAFWDQVERASDKLVDVAAALQRAQTNGRKYDAALLRHEGSEEIPVFGVSYSTLADIRNIVASATRRLEAVSYTAQKNHQFAQIYEMRRNTRTLVEGFGSLHEAINGLGSRVEGAIFSLQETVAKGFTVTARALDQIHEAIEKLVRLEEHNTDIVTHGTRELEATRATVDRSYEEMRKYARFSRASMVEALTNDHEIKTMLRGIATGTASPSRTFRSSPYSSDLYGTILDPGPKIPT